MALIRRAPVETPVPVVGGEALFSRVRAWVEFFNRLAFNDGQSPTVGTSAWTYTNPTREAQEFHYYGGTITGVTRTRNGTAFTLGGGFLTHGSVLLEPNDSITITYAVAPTARMIPH